MAARHKSTASLDLREHGTGNPGGLNATKVLGLRWGLAVIAADITKGAVASLLGRRIAGDAGAYTAGSSAVAGHCLPPWSGFRGGKGVATSAGTTLVCFPVYTPLDVTLATGLVRLSKGDANLAVLTASSLFTAASLIWWRKRWQNLWGPRGSWGLPAYAAITSVLVVWRMLSAPPAAAATSRGEVAA